SRTNGFRRQSRGAAIPVVQRSHPRSRCSPASKADMSWIDNHCHLRAGEHGADAIRDARAAGVTRLITVGTDLQQSQIATRIAAANDGVWATAGVHPHDATTGIEGIELLLDHPKVVAVGEAGLDYYYDHSPRADQRSVFAAQVMLANARDLPLVI